jgi:PKD repeat protein
MTRKISLFAWMCIVALWFAPQLNAQNLLTGGDMESDAAWTLAPFNTADVLYDWAYTADAPLSGKDGVLHVTVQTSTAAQSGIYQAVELTAGESYSVDAAVKIIGQVKTAWFQVFVGQTDPATTTGDYVPSTEEGAIVTQIASYYSWWSTATTPPKPNSTIQAGAASKLAFVPTTTGTYYFLIKWGANASGYQEVLVDNIRFGKDIDPVITVPTAAFVADKRVGFAPMAVNLKSASVQATTFGWDLGDDATSTADELDHIYSAPGKYTVSLEVGNDVGEDKVTKDNYITVMAPVEITAGGVIGGGNMENPNAWGRTLLNSPIDLGEETCLSTIDTTWNYTGNDTPVAGNGGALHIRATAAGGDNVQYCIWQKVYLLSSRIYRFDGAFRDNSDNLRHFWSEAYIGSEAPVSGSDYGASNGTLLASLSNWETADGVVKKMDGTYQLNATNNKGYTPDLDGDYYFVFKVGSSGNGLTAEVPDNVFDVIIDELSLAEINPKPFTDFTAENESGFSPLTVTFKNTTQYGDTYEWDFGDGSSKSTVFEPTHTYTDLGDYTVTLKASNAQGDSTLTKIGFVSVVAPYSLPDGEKLYGGDMTRGGYWKTTPYGLNLKSNVTWNYTAEPFEGSVDGVVRVVNNRIAFYQPVQVRMGYVYKFDCDVWVKSSSTNMWIQTFMWETEPPQDTDILTAANTMGELRTYADGTVSGYAGKFTEKSIKGTSYTGDKGTFKATADETRYFVIKLGTNNTMDVLLDNLSLKEYLAPVEPLFTSFTVEGDAPLEVEFFDLTGGDPQSWLWDFGDGSTSTESDVVVHTYTTPGVYTVSLTVTDKNGLAATVTMENYITVTGESAITAPAGENVKVVPVNKSIVVVSTEKAAIALYDIRGVLIEKAEGNYFKSKELAQGVYIVNVNGRAFKTIVKQ